MKKINSFLLAVLMLAVFACGSNMSGEQNGDADKDPGGSSDVSGQSANVDVDKVLSGYMKLKDALVSGDGGTAKLEASKLVAKMEGHPAASIVEAIKDAEEIGTQRAQFSALSDAVYTLLKEKGGNKKAVYKQFCPMAFDNKGASWLSNDEAIKNPYFGDEMLTCGEVKETIAAK